MSIKVLHLSSPGYRTAGKLAFDIHSEFMNQGYESFMISKDNNYGFRNSVSYHGSFYSKAEKYINRLKKKTGFEQEQDIKYGYHYIDQDNFQLPYRHILDKSPFEPDIIMIYAVHEFINAKTIKMIAGKSKAKIFWLFYDMGPMTGGCHYCWDCGGYEKECGRCPWLMSDDPEDFSYKNLKFKDRYLKDIDIEILICSEWLMGKAEKSSLLKGRRLHKWMMPVDLNQFIKTDKNAVKKILGLDPEKKYIFFGSVNLDNPRKGTEYLIEAVKMLFGKREDLRNAELIIPGYSDSLADFSPGYKCILPGFIYDRETLIRYYQAAHTVVVPSVEDTGPLMISEATACGTPVVAFDMGSARDVVHTGITGYRAELKDSNDLCKGIEFILDMSDEEYEKMSAECVKLARQKFEISGQIKKVIDIYQNKV